MLHTIISNVRDLEASSTVGFIGLEVNPQTSGASCEGNGPLICLTSLVGGDRRSWPLKKNRKNHNGQAIRSLHRHHNQINRSETPTVLPHNQYISAIILWGQENLRHHDKDLALAGWVDVPDTLHIGRVITRIVRWLNITHKLTHLTTALSV